MRISAVGYSFESGWFAVTGNVCISKLTPRIKDFLEFKHSLGLKYITGEYYLQRFDQFYAQEESELPKLKDVIKLWAIRRDNEWPSTQHVRLAPIREFGKYLQVTGYLDSFVLPKKVCQKQIRSMPHFFTNDEIVIFFSICDTLKPRKENIVRHLVLPMLFRLLYCCGLRTCEARLLLRENVNLHSSYIDILASKGLKDRRIFLPEDLRSLFVKYDLVVNEILPERTYFFPVNAVSGYQCSSISQNFNKIWKAAGLGNESGAKPRAYDFRHHFAFANLNRWVRDGIDVNAMLPYLMRCMGHSSLKSTFYYLHLVPEFFVIFCEKAKPLERLLPEVNYDEEEQ